MASATRFAAGKRDKSLDVYIIAITAFGVLVLLTAWVPLLLANAPLSLPIVCLGIGAAVGAVPSLAWLVPQPEAHLAVVERLTELLVIVSLMGAGLKIDRPAGWRPWRTTWRLLGLAMPLTILLLGLLANQLLGLGVAAALLLAAVLAPTDPVLASDIQVGPPNSGEEDEIRFSLTSEAGLNDALAFPFVNAAILLSAAMTVGGGWFWEWLGVDVAWKLSAGLVVGWVVGRALAWLLFRIPHRAQLSRSGDGFVALGITCAAYGLTELVHGYGFLAVFVAARALRAEERDHEYQRKLHDFSEELERLMMMALLVGFGAAITGADLFGNLSWAGAAFAVVALFVIRPLTGWIGFFGAGLPKEERAVISFYGIRGIGSMYYLSYGIREGTFEAPEVLWSTLAFTVFLSILIHGTTVTPVMRALERRREEG